MSTVILQAVLEISVLQSASFFFIVKIFQYAENFQHNK